MVQNNTTFLIAQWQREPEGANYGVKGLALGSYFVVPTVASDVASLEGLPDT